MSDQVKGFLEEKQTKNGERSRSMARLLLASLIVLATAGYAAVILYEVRSDDPEPAPWCLRAAGDPAQADSEDARQAVFDRIVACNQIALALDESRATRTKDLLNDWKNLVWAPVIAYGAKQFGFAIPKIGGGG